MQVNKRKIINDPVYGFINIPSELIFDLIQHPYFQRLRRIKQLGLTHLVYPGALHTRFHHSLGAMHLMQEAIAVLKMKGQKITHEEEEAVLIAILLHDAGHGPFSHALEHAIIKGSSHEDISGLIMQELNRNFNGRLETGIAIFQHKYPKKFLSQLVSSQLDMDRLDYLSRDSFFTGVSEGVIGTQRIIKMLNVSGGNLVVEEKGIYSIEKYIIARRIMYWQVYLHKTVLSAENMLIKILERAKYLTKEGKELFATPALSFFLKNQPGSIEAFNQPEILNHFTNLDDFDILASIKTWTNDPDKVLSSLCKRLIDRNLYRCVIQADAFDYFFIEDLKEKITSILQLKSEELIYFFISDTTSNYAYNIGHDKIFILSKDGKVNEIGAASDHLNISVLSKATTKHFICYPKDI
ncbi:MAG: HD domain-containing protein [Bacteroidales bacterium]|nr:HD domain-containing protein [Bacteroidales bacterium]MCF8405643.1 HD domain-containing protein [Bacteroidales bacterium]